MEKKFFVYHEYLFQEHLPNSYRNYYGQIDNAKWLLQAYERHPKKFQPEWEKNLNMKTSLFCREFLTYEKGLKHQKTIKNIDFSNQIFLNTLYLSKKKT